MPDNNNLGPIGTAALGIGTGAVQGAVGSLLGLALEHHNDKRQLNQQTKLQALQIKGQEQMADYNYQKQLDMWNATNYEAQMQHLKAAGLNPGLLYGQGGGGGTTIGSGYSESVSGADAPRGGGEQLAYTGMGIQLEQQAMQLQLLKAQKENIEADTAAKQANANYTSGAQTAATVAQTDVLLQDVQNKQAERELTKVKTNLEELNVEYQKGSLQDRLDQAKWTAIQSFNTVNLLANENMISNATIQAKIDTIKQEAIGSVLRNTLTEIQQQMGITSIQLDKQKIAESAASIAQKWTGLNQQQQQILLQQEFQKYELNPSWNKVWNSLETSVGKAISGIATVKAAQ